MNTCVLNIILNDLLETTKVLFLYVVRTTFIQYNSALLKCFVYPFDIIYYNIFDNNVK